MAGASNGARTPGSRWLSYLVALILLAAGLALLVPGLALLGIGGSAYYAVVGLAAIGTAILAARRKPAVALAYAALLFGTTLWGLWEVGLDPWALMPRLVFWIVGGIAVALVCAASRAERRALWVSIGSATGVFLIAWILHSPFEAGPARWSGQPRAVAANGDWAHYGNSQGGSRFSPLAEITPANVTGLERAWTFRSGLTMPGGKRKGGLQVTPLMVDGVLYGCTAFSSVFALDPVTGKQLWRHDPKLAENSGGHPACRGIAFFRAPAGVAECSTRLILGTIDNRLIALDAKTGKPCTSFGEGGATSLQDGIGDFQKRWSHPTSPPTIVNGVAVIGAYVADNQATKVPPGVIRGYDAVTGKIRWAFDPGRPNDQRPLPPGQNYTPSTPNSWTLFSGDDALGLVYIPMGNGSPDFVGGQRSPETERVTSSLVALDGATGAVRWTFQAVRHDLWDYDLAAQPVLVDFPTGNGTTPGLILPTKTGQLFVLDRRTGKPLIKVEERQVPRSTLPGERGSPTQPFAVGMPDVAGKPLEELDMWGLTPFDQLWCRIQFRRAHYEGMFTPPRLGPTLRYPGELGGIDWGSVSVDESRGLLIVNSNHMADRDELITRAQARAEGLVVKSDPKTHSAPGAPMEGTPYAIHWGPFMSGLQVPCQRPPYGYLTAIDLKTRKILWMRTLGDSRNSGPWGFGLGLPLPLGAPNIGGSIATASGLIFIAATQDEMFRAVDTGTGKILWQDKLPVSGHATPMSYRGRDGHQYVVIAAGGGSLRDRPGDYFIAYRLKR
ncbi:MAG: membrane-bound PQQ-dependent dehydrogenase, glucose/quinate/shikimate family [Sphingomonas sp.]|uniref:membrane-bound PQQ-dependent dehydrogenase, glucose/quinate/shikimate family n=1 Tax=Sphingomonas sp. TaxID=28214 RepID=UPI0035635299